MLNTNKKAMKKFIDNQFDKKFSKIKSLKWKPWVGKNYLDKKKPKLLILGESHYLWEGEDEAFEILNSSRFTRAFIKDCGLYFDSDHKGNANAHIIRNTERVFYNQKDSTDDMKRNLWYSVSYMVNVQRILSSIDERPIFRDFVNGWKSIFKVIEIIKPDYIISLGVQSSNSLSKATRESDVELLNFEKGNKVGNVYSRKAKIKSGNVEIPIIFIQHPSSYFSWNKWSEYVDKEMSEYVVALKK